MHSDVIYLVKNFRYKKESIEICSYIFIYVNINIYVCVCVCACVCVCVPATAADVAIAPTAFQYIPLTV